MVHIALALPYVADGSVSLCSPSVASLALGIKRLKIATPSDSGLHFSERLCSIEQWSPTFVYIGIIWRSA